MHCRTPDCAHSDHNEIRSMAGRQHCSWLPPGGYLIRTQWAQVTCGSVSARSRLG